MDNVANKNNKRGMKKIGFYLLEAMLVIWAIIQLYPLFWLFLFSVKNNTEIFGGNILGFPRIWQWSNYSEALSSGNVGRYFINSSIVTVLTIVISSILVATSAYAIVRMKWKYSKLVLTIFLMGMMVPIHATLLPLFIILKNLNLLNTYASLVIPYVAFAIPMGIFILTGFLYTIPRELEESAFLDGCSIYKSFYYIILPLIRPALATIAIFTYLSTWNELMFANTFINDDAIKTLTVGIMSLSGQYQTEWGPIGAGLVIATIPTILIYVLLSEQVQKSLVVGAVKG
ncbi:carbohydrate ABC transporter permease [Thermoanaerobacterium thermosaccharolyticum]|uniref:Binding-protein-dependent transport systems inner membrane component n=1 Tax=Thermoanaerobacterium thermosaccharolyticum (strain ATCC 7956 / DSM 571 / NCIMB 9385 / NCA 3814 / NCTC 13789 / WDCM 00135 / 2032) TaxID=580327 RepID=D9TN04_THETC|nr:carbohydrate ABC transporter permease [Thermoanaerobacterium thermosaccharolyticum]ADL68527.1 binding-protein-dependent transport systems inner membrane component [Thermoanaerobacterium thermosaccharolyticum DSM 571]KAA5806424.1 carbohydrate ABC transporter permease [Thermoanaerobacterium thermosaccharolyticum]